MTPNFSRLEELARAMKPRLQTGQSFHVTFVYKGPKMICVANNDYTKLHRYHKFGEYKPVKPGCRKYIAGLHSECAAIIKMGRNDCSDLTFINIRINNRDERAPSKPCVNCRDLVNRVGYKSFWYYSTSHQYVKHKGVFTPVSS